LVPTNNAGTQTNLVNATSIDFIACNGASCVPPPQVPVLTPGVAGQFLVTSATGSFGTGAGNLNLAGQIGAIKDFTFSGAGTANFPNVPISAFEVVPQGGPTLTFDLTTVSIVQQNANCGSGGVGHSCIDL